MAASRKFLISLAILTAWIAITVLSGLLQLTGAGENPLEALSRTIGLGFVAACLFLAAMAALLRWDHMGFGRPRPLSSLIALWLPLAYIALILFGAAALGFPPAPVVAIVSVNMLLVGFSEEVMFRGLLLRGALSRFRIRTAVIISTLGFGAIHLLNGLMSGAFPIAAAQAVAACMSGTFFVAVRIRSQSVWPMVVIHGLWNFSLFMLLNASGPISEQNKVELGPQLAAPLLLVAPLFVYGLILMRRLERDYGFMSERNPQ